MMEDLHKIAGLIESIMQKLQRNEPVDSIKFEELVNEVEQNPTIFWNYLNIVGFSGKLLVCVLTMGRYIGQIEQQTRIAHLSYAYLSNALSAVTSELQDSIADGVTSEIDAAYTRTELYKDRIVLLFYYGNYLKNTVGYLNGGGQGPMSYFSITAQATARHMVYLMGLTDIENYKNDIQFLVNRNLLIPEGAAQVLKIAEEYNKLGIKASIEAFETAKELHSKLFKHCTQIIFENSNLEF
jgi:hypothetical protein